MAKLVLFQGDSITDVGRDRNNLKADQEAALGDGYPKRVAEQHKDRTDLSFLNRGISGNRVVDLYARWKIDALNLKPDVISILIGVNDVWHEFNKQNGVEAKRFNVIYRMLLDLSKEHLPNVQLIICEPFILPCGVIDDRWSDEMSERQSIVKQIAQDYQATFVPFQAVFNQALEEAAAETWAADGVHPTVKGHKLLADTWLEHVSL